MAVILPSVYKDGTATVNNGSTTVTGQNTLFVNSVLPGDFFGSSQGVWVRIASVDSNTTLTLAHEWPEATQTAAPYEIMLQSDNARMQETSRQLLETLSSGNNYSLGQLNGNVDQIPIFSAPGVFTLVSKNELLSGVNFDVIVNDMAGRAAFDNQNTGFTVLVIDIGDGRSAAYAKNSATPGDWSNPIYVTGPVGPAGYVNLRDTYDAGTAYAKNDGVLYNGSSFVALQATTGNAPPTLPTTSNAYWQLLAVKGMDGSGTGDVIGPSSSVNNQIALMSGTTGKLIKSGPTIGGAASLNVGSTAGTVAAGDDIRFSEGEKNAAILALEIADIKGSRLAMKSGIADPFDDEIGVATKTNAVYDAANDWYSPTIAASQTNATGSSFVASGMFTLVSRQFSLTPSKSLAYIGLFAPNSGTYTVKIVQRNSATNYTVIQSHSFEHPGGGWFDFQLPAAYVIPASGTFYLASVQPTTGTFNGTSTTRTYYTGDAPLGATSGWTEDTGNILPLRSTYSADNMTLGSVNYTASFIPNLGNLTVQTAETTSVTANTDLIARISRDGGTTWATSVLILSQPVVGQKIYEAAGINLSVLGSGTLMKWEISTANKSFSVSGVVP